MATQVQNRRGTTAEHSTFTGAVGELTVDTTKDTVVVHDGAVAGGRPLLREDQSNLPTSAPTTGIYSASGSLAISTGGSGRLFVDSSGNVKIGNSASVGILNVRAATNGNLHFRDIATVVGSGTGVVLDVLNDASTTVQDLAFRGATTIFRNASSETLRITSAGLVGIGTSVPDSTITIKQDISSATAITAANSQVGISSGSGSGANFRSTLYFNPLNSSGNGSPAAISAIASGNTNSSLAFYTNGSSNYTGTPVERLRIDDQGRVGIGASSPSYNLQVAETSAVVSAASYSTFFGQGTRADLVLRATSSNNDQQRQVIRSNSDSLIFGTENSAVTAFTEKLRITSAGFVGVGTSIPGDQLDVAAGNYRGATIKCGTTGHRPTLSFLNTADSLAAYIQAVGNSLTFGTMATDYGGHSPRMTLTSTGLGIGTTAPQRKLHIAASGGEGIEIEAGESSNRNYTLHYNRTAGVFVLNEVNASQHVFLIGNNNEAARIDSSKRLLVGTSSALDGSPIQVRNDSGSSLSVVRSSADGFGPTINIYKSRGTAGSPAEVNNGDNLGYINFSGYDGAGYSVAANIEAQADGTWTDGGDTTDSPGRLVFSTTADGASSPTERMRITNGGFLKASDAGTYQGTTSLYHELRSSSNGRTAIVSATNASFTDGSLTVNVVKAANSNYQFVDCFSGDFADKEINLRGDGNGLCDGAWTGGGADYAEYFEWSDSNPNAEDRRGISVVLDGDKIREAVAGEDPIGVISGNPSVVGDAAWNKWSGKYLRDEFGTYIQEDYEVADDDGNTVIQQRRKLNPAYDPDVEYISREQRPEWDCVGLMGKLRIRKGQVTGSRWIKMRDINDSVEEWLVR